MRVIGLPFSQLKEIALSFTKRHLFFKSATLRSEAKKCSHAIFSTSPPKNQGPRRTLLHSLLLCKDRLQARHCSPGTPSRLGLALLQTELSSEVPRSKSAPALDQSKASSEHDPATTFHWEDHFRTRGDSKMKRLNSRRACGRRNNRCGRNR